MSPFLITPDNNASVPSFVTVISPLLFVMSPSTVIVVPLLLNKIFLSFSIVLSTSIVPLPAFSILKSFPLSIVPVTLKFVPSFLIWTLLPFVIPAPTLKEPLPSFNIAKSFVLFIVPFTVAS